MKEEIRQQVLEDIYDYLKENIDDYETRAKLALNRMDRNRAPLYHVDSELHAAISDYVAEWLANEIDNEDLLYVEKQERKTSVFDMINALGQFADIIKEIAEKVREDRPDVAGYLDGAHRSIGGAYVELNTYLEEL